ncbi:MAG: hypothetical protein EON89_00960 [Brevundimonas sp.]|nr:MAG: hypothetical protein EON89_00960 [Brevundimonas sp.]
MSDVAVTWSKAQDCPTSKAKQVLGCLATYADVEGEVWALVPVLAMESQSTDRTVQRALSALKGAGLIIPTGRFHVHRGKRVPIWRLNLDHGFASTRARMLAESRARSGDASVTPSAPPRVTPVSPQNVADVTARGDTGDTQIGKGDSQGLTPSASACAKAQRLWAGKAPERVSPVRVAASWGEAIRRTGVQAEPLLAAVTAAVRRDPDFGRGKAMNLDRWLDEDRFLPWLNDDDEPAASTRAVWTGPDDVRAAVVSAMGESGAAAYLDPARWDEGRRVIVARTTLAVDRLKAGARSAFGRMNITVECEAKRG